MQCRFCFEAHWVQVKAWQVPPVAAMHSTTGELLAEGAARVQNCTNSRPSWPKPETGNKDFY